MLPLQQHWGANCKPCLPHIFQLLSPSNVSNRRSTRLHVSFMQAGLSFQWGEKCRGNNRREEENNCSQKGNSYAVACQLKWGSEITFGAQCLPVFTKSVVIHALGLHVWVKVFFFFNCPQNKNKKTTSVVSGRGSCGAVAPDSSVVWAGSRLCLWLAVFFPQFTVHTYKRLQNVKQMLSNVGLI